MNKVRWGILGTAGIAKKELIPAFQRASNAVVTAVATSSQLEKAEMMTKEFEIEKAYGSYEELLSDPEIDGVYIPLPNHLHKKWVIAAAQKGKHILCEKPAGLNTTEVKEMKQVCEEHNVLFMEGFMYYFHPQHTRVKQIIESGEIGTIQSMHAAFTFLLGNRENSIKMNEHTGGGSLYDVGCYGIHAIRNVLGMEPKKVQMHAKVDSEYHVDTDVIGYLEFSNGVRATVESSFNQMKRSEYEVIGTEGRISVPRAFRPDWFGGDGLVIVEKGNITRTETINEDPYKAEVEHISDKVLTDQTDITVDFENSINNMQVIDASLESIRTGKPVNL